MTNSRLLKTLLFSTSLLGACVASSDAPTDVEPSSVGTRVHMMPLHGANKVVEVVEVTPQVSGMMYFGGPLLKNISVHPVFWNSSTQFQSNLSAFYNGVTGSLWWNILAQYGIGPGSGVPGVVDTKSTANVTDAAVQTELNRLFSAGSLPPPNANTYYPVHFPPGMTITAPDGSKSCVQFCAYHGTYVRGGVNVNYGVAPDQGGGCAGGCGANALRVNNLDAVASHELAGAATDPAVGLATVFGPPLGWYDPNLGEIADICTGQGTTVGRDGVTYTIQLLWSSAANACVAH
jgi:hypothetical protein